MKYEENTYITTQERVQKLKARRHIVFDIVYLGYAHDECA